MNLNLAKYKMFFSYSGCHFSQLQ